MRRVLFILVFAIVPATGSTQGTDREAVLKTVQMFFDTMTASDVDGARKILIPEGRFFAMEMRKPNAPPQSFTNEEYFARLQRGKQSNRERMWNPEVRVRGTIATVWTPYDFWIDGKFSHCGIDAFMLVKVGVTWKITQLADSRRTEGCTHK